MKLTSALRYMFASLLTMLALATIAYWILRPAEWRPQLLHLLYLSFAALTGPDPTAWLVSHVYSSVFTVLVTVALVGIARGPSAMRVHWVQTSSIALLALSAQVMLFYGSAYLRVVARTVYEDHQLHASANLRLTQENKNLNEEVSRLNILSRKAQSHAKSVTLLQKETAKQLSKDARTNASDVVAYQDLRLRNLPTVLIGGAPELSRKSMEDSLLYNHQAIVDFLKTFGGPIESIMRQAKPYGVDTSRLQRHIAELNSIQMMRLIGNDLNDIADQLGADNRVAFNRLAQKAHCPSYYVSCPD